MRRQDSAFEAEAAGLVRIWDALRSSYWFLPALMGASAVGLSQGLQMLDQALGYDWAVGVGLLHTQTAQGARSLLSAAAGSIITVAGVAFSITVVALVLAASKLGSKVLRTFMRDTGNQVSLGIFVAAFTYCVLVLRTIQGQDGAGPRFVPTLSVSVGILLTLASMATLVYFIHHVGVIIQADHVLSAIASDLRATVDRLYPERVGAGLPPEAPPERPPGEPVTVVLKKQGYLQAVEGGKLLKLAAAEGWVIRVACRPGHFIREGMRVAEVWPASKVSEAGLRAIRGMLVVGRHRTTVQDVEFALQEFIQVALLALSPGINDVLTAITAMDWLGAELCRYGERRIPSPYRRDPDGTLRLILRPITPREVADAALHPLRQATRGDAWARRRLLMMIAEVGRAARAEEFRRALREHLDLFGAELGEGLPSPADRAEAERLYREALDALSPA